MKTLKQVVGALGVLLIITPATGLSADNVAVRSAIASQIAMKTEYQSEALSKSGRAQ